MATLQIKIPKADTTLEVDTDKIPEGAYQQIVSAGLQHYLTAKMAKIAVRDLEGDDLQKAREKAFEVANENLEDIYNDRLRKTGGKRGRTNSAVNTEAIRLAKIAVKAILKEKGVKISSYKASEITAAAKSMVEVNHSFVKQAEANLAAASTVTPDLTLPEAFIARGEKASPKRGRPKKEEKTARARA